MATERKSNGRAATSIGMAVDAKGNVAYDPSANVLSLVEAAVTRIDDIAALRSDYESKLATAESRRLDDISALRADYEGKLATAESKRIDAIRAVDVNAVAVASQRAADQATVLANQVSLSAETIRKALDTTASTIAAQMESKFAGMTERIAALEKSSYEGAGKQAVQDPQMAELTSAIKQLTERRAQDVGKTEGYGNIKTAIMLALAIGGFALGYLIPLMRAK